MQELQNCSRSGDKMTSYNWQEQQLLQVVEGEAFGEATTEVKRTVSLMVVLFCCTVLCLSLPRAR